MFMSCALIHFMLHLHWNPGSSSKVPAWSISYRILHVWIIDAESHMLCSSIMWTVSFSAACNESMRSNQCLIITVWASDPFPRPEVKKPLRKMIYLYFTSTKIISFNATPGLAPVNNGWRSLMSSWVLQEISIAWWMLCNGGLCCDLRRTH